MRLTVRHPLFIYLCSSASLKQRTHTRNRVISLICRRRILPEDHAKRRRYGVGREGTGLVLFVFQYHILHFSSKDEKVWWFPDWNIKVNSSDSGPVQLHMKWNRYAVRRAIKRKCALSFSTWIQLYYLRNAFVSALYIQWHLSYTICCTRMHLQNNEPRRRCVRRLVYTMLYYRISFVSWNRVY